MKKYTWIFVGVLLIVAMATVVCLVMEVAGGIHLEYTEAADVERAIIAPFLALAAGVAVYIKRHYFTR